jgi:hypothetical protein
VRPYSFGQCHPEAPPAYGARATVPGKTPLQAAVPCGAAVPQRPWLNAQQSAHR